MGLTRLVLQFSISSFEGKENSITKSITKSIKLLPPLWYVYKEKLRNERKMTLNNKKKTDMWGIDEEIMQEVKMSTACSMPFSSNVLAPRYSTA